MHNFNSYKPTETVEERAGPDEVQSGMEVEEGLLSEDVSCNEDNSDEFVRSLDRNQSLDDADDCRLLDLKSAAPKRILCIQPEFLNIILLGVGFMFSIGAYQTCAMAQTVVLNSVHDAWFDGTPTMGYICLAINCSVQAAAYLLGPILVAKIGPKTSLVFGGFCISLYISCFIRPLVVTLYLGSAILGAGVGIIWVVQGYFVTVNSTPRTNARNTGIFWALYQSSLISGNMFYFLMLHGQDSIDEPTRKIVFYTLLGVSVIGTVIFALIIHPWFGKPKQTSDSLNATAVSENIFDQSAKRVLASTIKFAIKREMWILLPMFLYIGIELSFWVNVYATCLGYTLRFGIIRESLVGLNGVFIGIGEIFGGLVLGWFGKWSHRKGKDPGLLLAMIVHLSCFYLVFLNLPAQSPLGKTGDKSVLEPNEYLAMGCAFLLGFGDAVWNNQLMAFLGIVYPQQTVIAFAVYQFWGSIGNTMAYLYSTVLILPYQLLLLVLTSIPAAFGFFYEEWKYSFLASEEIQTFRRKFTSESSVAESETSNKSYSSVHTEQSLVV